MGKDIKPQSDWNKFTDTAVLTIKGATTDHHFVQLLSLATSFEYTTPPEFHFGLPDELFTKITDRLPYCVLTFTALTARQRFRVYFHVRVLKELMKLDLCFCVFMYSEVFFPADNIFIMRLYVFFSHNIHSSLPIFVGYCQICSFINEK